ncbi:LysR family transcriptional regulator [Paracoccus sp. (in: a-proteobacteria)]|uniref:LysR family transcriptional regulator n=1 Tax=Paracoccus sp. TaxID=267 RepID=UPI003A873408
MDLRRADLGLLVSLDALLSERSVTAAARKLGISQPALSAQLARLRDLLDDDVLVGNAHGMVPTARAQALQGPLHALLKDMSDLIFAEAGFDPATSERRFHLAGADLSLALVLPPLMRHLRDAAPGLRISTGGLDHDRIEADARAGRLDLVVTSAERMPQSFHSTRLIEAEYRVIWRQDHPQLAGGISLDQFCTLPHLHVSPFEDWLQGPVDQVLQVQGLRRVVSASVSNYVLAPALLRASDLIAVVPRILLDIDGAGLAEAALPIDIAPLAAHLGWHPRNRNDRAHQWLRRAVVSLFRGGAG